MRSLKMKNRLVGTYEKILIKAWYKMKEQYELLIEILFDQTAREDERGDAAIDLRYYKNITVMRALAKCASNPKEDDVIMENSAESLGEICAALNIFDENLFKTLIPYAKKRVYHMILAGNPDLIPSDLRERLEKEFDLR